MATASRPSSGAYTSLFTHVLEDWWNGRKAEDTVFENIPLYWILSKTSKKSRPLPAYLNVRLLQDESEGGDSFTGYDRVSVAPSKGAQAASFSVANYSWPITMPLTEEWEYTSPQAIADRLEEYVEQVQLTAAQRLALDGYVGNNLKSTNILGLQQAIYPKSHSGAGALDYIDARWKARQANNAFGGITRVAYTSAFAPGTGWENVSVDASDSGGAKTFGYTSGAPNTALKALHNTYSFCSYGVMTPDLMISSRQPFDDYEFAAMEKTQIRKESSSFGDIQLGFDNLKFKNAVWICDEFANITNTGAGDAIVTTTPSKGTVWFLNTKYVDLAVDSRADFDLRPPKEPVDQHVAVRHMVWRGQLVFRNPRYCGVLFNYGIA